MGRHQCGPAASPSYFRALLMIMHDCGASFRYHISCTDHERDILGIDFKKTAGLSTAIDGRIITRFYGRDEIDTHKATAYKWLSGVPIAYMLAAKDEFGGPQIDDDLFERIAGLSDHYPTESALYAILSANSLNSLGGSHFSVIEGAEVHQYPQEKDVAKKKGKGTKPQPICCSWDDNDGSCSGIWYPP